MSQVSKPNSSITNESFTQDQRVVGYLQELHNKFDKEHPLIVSDVLDAFENQYVNLVQKGGGVLGIALVGYTYVLEQMGIRFMRLAGTSAGAINTAMMTVIGNKEDAKSNEIIEALRKLDFFCLVDGHAFARFFIKKFITHQDFGVKIKKWIKATVGIVFLLFFADLFLLGLQHVYPWAIVATRVSFLLTGVGLLGFGILAFYVKNLLRLLKNSGFGINPGDFFYDWIKGQLRFHGVNTVDDLNRKASAPIRGLHLRTPHEKNLEALKGDVTFITSELVTQNKIQFPEMAGLFRCPKDLNELQPAGFVRASMAIPVFFESYFINNIPCDDAGIRKLWKEKFGIDEPPSTARFVDGGILSNFPINLFYNADIRIPRLPTFGIDLDDSTPGDKSLQPEAWSMLGYFGRMFNTIRFYYDKDFRLKNQVLEMGIGKVPLSKYNWLNFFLKDSEKIDMFADGAKAARDFLFKFNWEEYKYARTKLNIDLEKANTPDSNIVKPINPDPNAVG